MIHLDEEQVFVTGSRSDNHDRNMRGTEDMIGQIDANTKADLLSVRAPANGAVVTEKALCSLVSSFEGHTGERGCEGLTGEAGGRHKAAADT